MPVQTLLAHARNGTLADDVLELAQLAPTPQLALLARLCLSPQPAQRPSARRLIAGLRHVKQHAPGDAVSIVEEAGASTGSGSERGSGSGRPGSGTAASSGSDANLVAQMAGAGAAGSSSP